MADDDARVWERGWDGHEEAQLRRLAQLTLIEKLAWLEEAQRVAGHLARSRDAQREAVMSRPPDFWDQRYIEPGYAYGTEPNDFVRDHAAAIPPGRVLCLGEGQGRNAVFLAERGFEVTAVDQSPVGISRARELARERDVHVETVVADLADFAIAPAAWQGIVSVFIHLPPPLRGDVHARVATGLAPGGAFVFEAYGPGQGAFGTGGPDDDARRPGLDVLRAELEGLEFEIARDVERDVIEGRYHTGRAATVQILARRPNAAGGRR